MSVLQFETHRVYDILEFAEAQKAVYDTIVTVRNKMRVELIDDLGRDGEVYICQDCENMPETVPKVSMNTYAGRKNSTYKATTSDTTQGATGTTVTAASIDKVLSYTERAKIRSKCRFLWNILRSFDFMIRNALYSSAATSMQKLRSALDLASNKKVVVEEPPAPPVVRGNSQRLPQVRAAQPKGPRKPITLVSIRPADGIFRINIMLNGSQTRIGEETVSTFALGIEPIKEHLVRTFHDALKYSIETGVYTHSLLLSHEFEALLLPISNSETRDCTLEDLVYSNKHNTLHVANNECIRLFCSDLDGCIRETLKYSHFADKYTNNTAYYRQIQGMSAKIRQNIPNAVNEFVPDVIANNMIRLGE